LGTIRIPRGNLNLLKGKLPVSQYEIDAPDEIEEEDNYEDDAFVRDEAKTPKENYHKSPAPPAELKVTPNKIPRPPQVHHK